MVAATALRMGLAGYDGGAACGVARNAEGKGQPSIVKGMVQQEWGELGGEGEEEGTTKGDKERCNNEDDENDNTAIAVAFTVSAIEDCGLPCATIACPKPQPQ